MAQTIFPASYQVDRGGMAAPGDYDPTQAQPTAAQQKRRYIRTPDGQGGWTYYVVPEGTQVDPARVAAAGGELVDLPAEWNVQDGYHEAATGAAQPPPSQAPTPVPAATQTATAPTAPPPPSTPAAPPQPQQYPPSGPQPTINNESGSPPDVRGRQWVRLTGRALDANGRPVAADVIGTGQDLNDQTSTIVPFDSPLAQAQMRNPQTAGQVRMIDTSYTVRGQPIIDPAVMTSENFQAIGRQLGNNIIDYAEVNVPDPENPSVQAKAYKVTWQLATGEKVSYTLGQAGGEGKNNYWRITGAPEINDTDVKDPKSKEADNNLKNAQTAYYQAQTAAQRGAITKQDLDNAKAAMDQAERDWNTAHGYGNRTHSEVIDDAKGRATVAQIGAQTENIAQQTASAAQGTVNQTVSNQLQAQRDADQAENQAFQFTQNYYTNRANIDNSNNSLAERAAEAQQNALTAAQTQRVSLANNRLSQATQGFSDDFRQANDLNQYVKPGSDKGFNAFMALQAMRYANAQKYGAFDVNDTDLRFDESKLPSGIRAFANPSAPSFATYPSLDDLRNEAYNTGERMGIHNRPTPPGTADIVRPKPVPNANNVPGPPGAARPGTSAAATQAAPKPSSAAPTAAPQPQARPGESLDDIITLANPSGGTTLISRGGYYYGLQHGQYGGYQVANAEPGSAYTVIDGQYVRNPSATVSPRPDQTQVGSLIDNAISPPAAQQAGNEQPTDILTVRNAYDGQVKQISRAEWAEQQQNYPYLRDDPRFEVINAESGSLYDRNPDGTYTRHADTPYGPPGPLPPNEQSYAPTDLGSGRVARADAVRPYTPAALADLSGPTAGLQYTQQVLANPDADPEELRRRRQQQMLDRLSSPQAIYGLFDGSYDPVSTFF